MARIDDPRRLALNVLVKVADGAYADAVLGRALYRSRLDQRDRQLATLLVYGTLARRASLDHGLSRWSSQPLDRLDIAVLELLRLGVFQIAYLDRVPAHAAVHATVDLADGDLRRARGLVNAVLRRASREGLDLPTGNEAEAVAVRTSHPLWLVQMWRQEYGEEACDRMLETDNEAAPSVVRALIERSDAIERLRESGVEAEPGQWAPDAVTVRPARELEGVAIAQGEASQLVVRYLAPEPAARVLDACAAPGGKTAYMAALVGEGGHVDAVDPGDHARRRIERSLAAAEVTGVDIFETTCQRFVESDEVSSYDAALVDAPCSGLGTLREHPEIRWRRVRRDLERFAKKQSVILDAAASRVRPGGVLVYSTCTLAKQENEDVVEAFLERSPDWERAAAPAGFPSALLDERGDLRTTPDRHDTDGFFAARLRRKD